MKFYNGNNIDKQGRISLGGLVDPNTKVEIWVDEKDFTLIHVKRYLELKDDVPEYGIHMTDSKSRVVIPKALRGNAVRALIASDMHNGGIVLKLVE